jgi:hypothetical protein
MQKTLHNFEDKIEYGSEGEQMVEDIHVRDNVVVIGQCNDQHDLSTLLEIHLGVL